MIFNNVPPWVDFLQTHPRLLNVFTALYDYREVVYAWPMIAISERLPRFIECQSRRLQLMTRSICVEEGFNLR